ncbi:hypothetical protein [Streptomyces antimicrobicus]|uniref:N-acetyltransferase domain-containing protein n=1 Tax=Streptomyces antimicrobicus TaxID=2883108 RepID=A0ABS8BAL4_9ACTN|nr:hypothetical protein [Streptomyces antimicrobicus]MCB5181661.1 hypothetical protein [Streptomyces antimicrobicus]
MVAGLALANAASVRVLHKAGFRRYDTPAGPATVSRFDLTATAPDPAQR